MSVRQKYVKLQTIVAVQLDLDTNGFSYQKWGGTQKCKRGDWLVWNGEDTYTVDQETFARTYRPTSRPGPVHRPGIYAKSSAVWAEPAKASGTIKTKEGTTDFKAGDYLVFNEPNGRDGYAIKKEKFDAMYDLEGTSQNFAD
jgi:hypothetical protein